MVETIEPLATQIDEQRLAEELVAQALADGVQLIGEGGLLTGLTKSVLECALEEELSDHLGYDKHDRNSALASNSLGIHSARGLLLGEHEQMTDDGVMLSEPVR